MLSITFKNVDRAETLACPADSTLVLTPVALRRGKDPIAVFRNDMWWVENVPYTGAELRLDINVHFMSPDLSALVLGPFPVLRLASTYLYAEDRLLASVQTGGLWLAQPNTKVYETIVLT